MMALLPIVVCCAPPIGLILIMLAYGHVRHPLSLAIIFGLMMGGLGFGLYNTSEYSDLTRFMEQAMLTQGLTIRESESLFVNSHISDSPLAVLWFWTIGQSGNAQLYPASIAFLEYTCLAYMVTDYAMSVKVPRRQYAILLLFLIISTPLFDSVNSVRSTPALALGTLAMYLECYKRRHYLIAVLFYCCAPLIHSVGFIVLPIRLLCEVAKRSWRIAVASAFLLLPGAFAVSGILNPLFVKLGFNVMSKLQTYVGGDASTSDYAAHVASTKFLIVRKWITFALMATSAYMAWQAQKSESSREGRAINELGSLTAAISMSFALIVAVPSYARFAYVAVPFTGISYLNSLAIPRSKDKGVVRNSHTVSKLIYQCLFAAYTALMCVNMYRRVDIAAFSAHILFGFLGAIAL